jgi:hypothetical protein
MATLIKMGVYGELNREISSARRLIERLAYTHGEEVIITSIREGAHSPGSLHPQGDAFDMRPLQKVTIPDIKKSLGLDYDVISEGDHWHIEYDPKVKK